MDFTSKGDNSMAAESLLEALLAKIRHDANAMIRIDGVGPQDDLVDSLRRKPEPSEISRGLEYRLAIFLYCAQTNRKVAQFLPDPAFP